MSSRTTLLVGASIYSFLVFSGAAGLGFAALPAVAYATGLFEIETEARGAFSLVTLKAVPFLVGLSAAAAMSYSWLLGRSIARRVAIYAATTLFTWVTGAAIAIFILG